MTTNNPQVLLMHQRDNASTVVCAMFATELLFSVVISASGVEFSQPVNAC